VSTRGSAGSAVGRAVSVSDTLRPVSQPRPIVKHKAE
jgi:hypothetical protein